MEARETDLGALLDHELHALGTAEALEEPHGNRSLDGIRELGAELHAGALSHPAVENSLALAAGSVEDGHGVALAEAEHASEVVRFLVAQEEFGAGDVGVVRPAGARAQAVR